MERIFKIIGEDNIEIKKKPSGFFGQVFRALIALFLVSFLSMTLNP